MNQHAELNIDLRQMILAIETAVSLVGMNDTNHGKRVGFIASQLGHKLGLSDQDIQYAFDLGLLHDCGVSTEQMHTELVNHFDWTDAHTHCEIGYHLLKDFEPLSQFAKPIRYHHTHWNELGEKKLSVHDARMANLVFLADRIDVLATPHYKTDILLARDEIATSIENCAGSYFDPAFIKPFRLLSRSEAFWIALEDRHITRYTWDMGQVESQQPLSYPQLRQLSLIMSYVVDQKSPFTAQHSIRVATLARYLGECYGLSTVQCAKIEIAGLLHDLGKLHTPDKILEKPGPLSDIERSIMNQHSFETYEILRHIKGLNEVATWAAYHHEGIDGAGYPFHPQPQDLSTEARIIAVADIFQALVQDRPYRNGMSLNKVLDILNDMTAKGRLDASIVELAHQNGEQSYQIAKGEVMNDSLNYLSFFPDD